MSHDPVLIVHGGAGNIPDDAVDAHVSGVREALRVGWAVLDAGGSALDAVEAAIVVMEDDEAFDAGRGSFLNQDGVVQLDAFIMDGASLAGGGVGCVETIRNPIRTARLVLEKSDHVYFVADGAERFAAANGVEMIDNRELVVPREQARFEELRGHLDEGVEVELFDGLRAGHDTVGAVALDADGNLAAGTSTGGLKFKPPGRVGDSSIVGSGCYADNESAAVSCTGSGEDIMRLVLGKWAVDRVAAGATPQEAAAEASARLGSRLKGQGGLIVLDRAGRPGIAFNAARMAWALRTSDAETASIGPR